MKRFAVAAAVFAVAAPATADTPVIGDDTGVSVFVVGILIGGILALWGRFEARIRAVERDLAAFKLEATRTFATPGAIEKAEDRLATSLDRASARIETAIGRIEGLSVELARIAEAMANLGASRQRSPRKVSGSTS